MSRSCKKTREPRPLSLILATFGLALALSALLHFVQGDFGINLTDEGHLWLCSLQTAGGAVPLRDFSSYDPGRYYWCAAGSLIFGQGPLALRLSLACFQVIALGFGLLALRRIVPTFRMLVIAGLVLALWMFPRYKMFDAGFAVATLFFAHRIIESPTRGRLLSAGILTGLAAFFGRNLGIYLLVAFAGSTFYAAFLGRLSAPGRTVIRFVAGGIIGFSPLLVLLVAAPGFPAAFLDSILRMFQSNARILPLPVPWPWLAEAGVQSGTKGFQDLLKGCLFLLPPLFAAAGSLRLLAAGRKGRPDIDLAAACLFVAVPFMHHAAVRSDFAHLATSIPPVLAGLMILPFTFRVANRRAAMVVLSIILMLPIFLLPKSRAPFAARTLIVTGQASPQLVQYTVRGDRLWYDSFMANNLSRLCAFVKDRVGEGEEVLIVPFAAGVYPILDRAFPLWDSYPLFPENEATQAREIERLRDRKVTWVLIDDVPIMNREDLRYSQTHAMIYDYLREHYKQLEDHSLSTYSIFHHPGNPPSPGDAMTSRKDDGS